MIALKDGLPLVKFDGGRIVAFERTWLVISLLTAAKKAGHPEWWLAEHLTESITTYLQLRFNENVLTLPRLAKAVRSVLRDLGYSEVAHHFKPAPPLSKISLLDIAREAGTGYELAFFDRLGRLLKMIMTEKSQQLQIIDLKHCVKLLRSKKIWSRDCERLQAEIVAFTREQINLNHSGHEINLSIS